MDHITLLEGNHATRDQGLCVMEAVAWFADEKHSDAPHCACPVIAAFARRLNDRLGDEQRQRLKDLIPALALSRASWPVTLKRAFIAADFAVRDAAPRALEACGFARRAASLRSLPEILDRKSALQAQNAAADADAAAGAADAYEKRLADDGIALIERMLAVTE